MTADAVRALVGIQYKAQGARLSDGGLDCAGACAEALALMDIHVPDHAWAWTGGDREAAIEAYLCMSGGTWSRVEGARREGDVYVTGRGTHLGVAVLVDVRLGMAITALPSVGVVLLPLARLGTIREALRWTPS